AAPQGSGYMLFQNPQEHLIMDTVKGQLEWAGILHGDSALCNTEKNRLSNYKSIVEYIIRICEDRELIQKRIDELSGGEKQLLACLIALSRKKSVICLDEPFSMLDKKNRLAVVDVLLKVLEQGDIRRRKNIAYGTAGENNRNSGFLSTTPEIFVSLHTGQPCEEFLAIVDYGLWVEHGRVEKISVGELRQRISYSIYIAAGRGWECIGNSSVLDKGIMQTAKSTINKAEVLLKLESLYFRYRDENSASSALRKNNNTLSSHKGHCKGASSKPLYGKKSKSHEEEGLNNYIISGVSFSVSKGEVHIITGDNGCGKSTLLSLMAGLLKPSNPSGYENSIKQKNKGGRIYYSSKAGIADISSDVSYISQYPKDHFTHETIEEEFVYHFKKNHFKAGHNLKMKADSQNYGQLKNILEDWRIVKPITTPVSRLSGGELKKAALAMELSHPSNLWILDEPTSGMDRDSFLLFLRHLYTHVANGGAAVISACSAHAELICKILSNSFETKETERNNRSGNTVKYPGNIFLWELRKGKLTPVEYCTLPDTQENLNLKSSRLSSQDIPAKGLVKYSTYPVGRVGTEPDGAVGTAFQNGLRESSLIKKVSLNKDFQKSVEKKGLIARVLPSLYWILLTGLLITLCAFSFFSHTFLLLISSNIPILLVLLSLLIVLGFVIHIEYHPLDARYLGLIAVLSTSASILRIPFAVLPNVQPSTVIIFITGAALGPSAGAITGMCVPLLSNAVLGHGPWTPAQMIAWSLCGMSGGGLRKLMDSLSVRMHGKAANAFMLVSVLMWGLLYGLFLDIWSFLIFFPPESRYLLPVLAAGLPFNIAHGIGNVLFYAFAGRRLYNMIGRYATKTRVLNLNEKIFLQSSEAPRC
ncbi:MAG: ATP-binding cassette domain-containing protein, partial [Thermoplasmata archaeon]